MIVTKTGSSVPAAILNERNGAAAAGSKTTAVASSAGDGRDCRITRRTCRGGRQLRSRLLPVGANQILARPSHLEWGLRAYEARRGGGGDAFKYGSQPKGINIILTDWPHSRVTVFGEGLPDDGSITRETNAAIYTPGGGYLKYGVREWGIDLVWSATPVYEWRIEPHECGQRIFNLTRGANLVGQMQYGVDWGWGHFEEWEG
ncbi:hypothetical protein [Micromonospora sp. DT227]|uniref:hypothetical protein n=1 Tax=Micromonospora sp. DT227 TaxID=3393433 RepID=UPI003CF231FC